MRGLVSGRDAELARLSRLLDDVATSAAAAAVVEGPAGIGKSTLLAAIEDEAEQRGFAVFRARSEEMERERAFGAIASLVKTIETDSASSLIDLIAADPGQGAGFRSVDALVDILEAKALTGPVLISLDDVQWADEWSVKAVGIVFRRLSRLPVGLIIGARPSPRGPDLRTLIATLTTRGLHFGLEPLGSDAVADLVRRATGREPTPRLRHALERAGGNPFFVRELYAALERDQMLVPSDEEIDVVATATPPGLLITVLHRMQSLSADALEAVRNAAVLSGSFTVHHLAVAMGQPEDTLLGPLLRLREEGILAEEGEAFRFRHDLLREAVYEDLGRPVRTAMHSRIGRAFAGAGVDILEVAHHLARGAQPGDSEAAERLIEAAQSGKATLTESAHLLRRALELAPGHPRATQVKRRLAALLHNSDRPAEAVPLLEEVLATLDDPIEQLDVVSALAVAALRSGDGRARREWRKRAAELAAGLRDSENPAVILHVAQCFFDEGDWERAAHTAERAIDLSRARGTMEWEEEAENTCAWLLAGLGRPARAAEHSARALALAAGRSSEPMRRFHHARVRSAGWDLDLATEESAWARRRAGELGAVAVQLKALLNSASLDYGAGRWDDALLHADTAWEMMRELGIASDGPHPALVHAWVALRRDRLEEVPRLLGEAGLNIAWIDLLMSMDRDEADRVTESAETILGNEDSWHYVPFAEGVLVDVARAGVRFGRDELAERAAQTAQRLAVSADAPSRELDVLRCAVLVKRDRSSADRAIELAERCPWPLQKAGTFEDVAGSLDAGRDELLDRAVAIYQTIGSDFDLRRLSEGPGSKVRRRTRPSRPVSGWEALTEAEVRVVQLAAEGLTNREIGERLFISHRTAGTHLAHAFDKLQVRSRVELARLVADRRKSGT